MAAEVVPEDAPGLLAWLQGWFTSMCDGDWNPTIQLHTLGNPGWRLKIELGENGAGQNDFERVRTERDEHDWVHAWVEDGIFEAACGPTNLSEALFLFREWISD